MPKWAVENRANKSLLAAITSHPRCRGRKAAGAAVVDDNGVNDRKAHIVLAHPEPASFNAHLASITYERLRNEGWQVSETNLYAADFDPREGPAHYENLQRPERFDVQLEQKLASDSDSLPDFVVQEVARLDAADLLILQYPMWWHLPPAILKGWFDRVLVYGKVYSSARRFEAGRFASKRAMLSVTVGTGEATYRYNGRSGDINLLLWPVHFSLAFVGYEILEPFIAYGVEAGLRYSSDEEVQERRRRIETELLNRCSRLDDARLVPFNKMAEWNADGTIRKTACAYSPFIRQREELDVG